MFLLGCYDGKREKKVKQSEKVSLNSSVFMFIFESSEGE